MTDKALSLVPQIEVELKAIRDTELGHGLLCGDALDHAIVAGKLLHTAKETVTSDVVNGKKGKWLPWLETNLGIPQTTASLYMRLAEHKDLVLDYKERVIGERMSIRQAVALLPPSEKGQKQSATAAQKREQAKAAKAEQARKAIAETIRPEEVVADVAVDEFLLMKGDDLDVEDIFNALKSALDQDQLLDLSTRLSTNVNEEADKAAEQEQEGEPVSAIQEQIKELKERNAVRRV
jgi:hypothetical protein